MKHLLMDFQLGECQGRLRGAERMERNNFPCCASLLQSMNKSSCLTGNCFILLKDF